MSQRVWVQSLFTIPNPDPEVQHRGRSVIGIALSVSILTFPSVGLVFQYPERLILIGALVATFMMYVGSIALVRRGFVDGGALLVVLAVLFSLVVIPVIIGQVSVVPFFLLIPVVIGAATLRASSIWRGVALTLAGLMVLALYASNNQQNAPSPNQIFWNSAGLIILLTVFGYISSRSTERLIRQAEHSQRQTEQVALALEREKRSLEVRVAERTAEVAAALAEARELNETQARLLEENTAQREVIRHLSVPMLPVDAGTLVVPLIGVIDDARLSSLQQRVLASIKQNHIRRIMLDISGVPMVDAFVAQGLIQTMGAARLLGAETTIVGIRPDVAEALIAIGLDLGSVHTASDLQSALRRR